MNKQNTEIIKDLELELLDCEGIQLGEDILPYIEKSFIKIRQQERKNLKSRLEIILTDPDNYLRGQLEDLIKELK